MLVRLDASSSYTQLLVAMLVLGIGVGSGLAVYTTVVQNVYPKKIGEVSSTLIFFRQLGGTIGLSAMGSVLVSSYIPAFHAALPGTLRHFLPASILGAFDNPLILLSPNALSQIRSGFSGYGEHGKVAFNILLQAVKTGLAQSVHNVFVLSLVVILFGLIAVFFLKEIPLRERKKADQHT
jgi:MFS family permease